MPAVKKALDAGDFLALEDGRFEAGGHVLEPGEVIVERLEKAGWEVASEGGITVALDLTLDDELRRESRVYDLIHQVNTMRKQAGLGLSDRISLFLPAGDQDLIGYRDWIAGEVLAVSVDVTSAGQVAFEKA